MNRKKFLSLLSLGAVAAAVAPQVLIPEPVEIGPKEILAMRTQMAHDIANIPVSQWGGWYSEQEALARLQLHKDFERFALFGERREYNRQFYSGEGWISSL